MLLAYRSVVWGWGVSAADSKGQGSQLYYSGTMRDGSLRFFICQMRIRRSAWLSPQVWQRRVRRDKEAGSCLGHTYLEGYTSALNQLGKAGSYLHSPPTRPGSLPTAQLLGRVGKQTSPEAIEQFAQGDTKNRAKLRSSPHGCELVSSGEWLIDDSETAFDKCCHCWDICL